MDDSHKKSTKCFSLLKMVVVPLVCENSEGVIPRGFGGIDLRLRLALAE